MTSYPRLQAIVAAVRQKTSFVPHTALVLGSGLGSFGEKISLEAAVPYAELPGFPISTVPGHQGRFLFGYVEEEPVVVMQGRVHYYEGYSMEEVVLPLRVMAALGARRLVLTNAAGGIDPAFHPGDLMVLTDHIASFVPSPLIGPNDGGVLSPAAGEAPRRREKAGDPSPGGDLPADHRAPVRNPCGNPPVPVSGRQCRRYEHGLRGHCRPAPGAGGLRHQLHHQPGRRLGK